MRSLIPALRRRVDTAPAGAAGRGQPMAPAGAPATFGGGCDCSGDHVRIRNLGIRYGSHRVVEGVDLDLPRNAITALIGPSGCGKSSLLSCLNRLCDLVPGCRVTGAVDFSWLDSTRLSRDPITLRRHVGMLFQKPNPFPFSIRRNLEFALRQHGIRNRGEVEDRIAASLREVGLWDEVGDRMDSPAMALSGGQQQRLCLARALVLDPCVLLMDEPCSALDPISTRVIEGLVRRLSEQRTIVLVTHSLGQARRLGDTVALMWKVDGVGRLVESGPADRFFESPANELTRAYLQYA